MRTLLTFLGLVLLVGCKDRGVVTVPDVTTPKTFTIKSRGHSVSGLAMHVRGQLDGIGYIHVARWETKALTGTIDWKMYHDWFEEGCTIYYRPEGVHSGSLTIEYEFH